MNIFEQYGIKEVADVTLYAIELDKYDDEVYIPILYFDTLKVSTIEQTAEQTSARGGLGNPELIIWDYGKEITVTLEDALYTPASQSLMWGGKFGTKHSKIYGAWNTVKYPKDRYGRLIYLKKLIAEEVVGNGWKVKETGKTYETEEDLIADGFISFYCPCDEKEKYMKQIPNCYNEKNKIIYEHDIPNQQLRPEGSAFYSTEEGVYYSSNVLRRKLEKAEIILDNFGKFEYSSYNEENKNPESCGCDCCCTEVTKHEYLWNDTDIRVSVLEGKQDLYYVEGVGVRYQTAAQNGEVDIKLAFRDLYNYNINNGTIEYDKNPVYNYTDEDTVINENGGLMYRVENFGKTITIYKNIKWEGVKKNGEIIHHIIRCPVGTFYIVEDWNYWGNNVHDLIHPIDSGINNVKVFERLEKCKAKRTFAINTDNNLRMNNYKNMKEYAQCSLVVYIDPRTMKPYEPNSDYFTKEDGGVVNGNLRIIKQYETYYRWTRDIAQEYTSIGHQIIVDAVHYPGTYRLVGETYSRSRKDGKDQRYQFEIPLCKMASDTNLTLQADGDPTTFTMNLKVLRKEDGTMMKLTQYDVDCIKNSGSTKVVPIGRIIIDDPFDPDKEPKDPEIKDEEEGPDDPVDPFAPQPKYAIKIESPEENSVYYLPLDIDYIKDGKAFIDIPENTEIISKENLIVKIQRSDWSEEVEDWVFSSERTLTKDDEYTIELYKKEG